MVSLFSPILRRHSRHKLQKPRKTAGARSSTLYPSRLQLWSPLWFPHCHATRKPWRCSYLPNLDHMHGIPSIQVGWRTPVLCRLCPSRHPVHRQNERNQHHFTPFVSGSSDPRLANNRAELAHIHNFGRDQRLTYADWISITPLNSPKFYY